MGSIGGTGVKIHPDFRYANLYYWLLDDSHLRPGWKATPLPLKARPYFDSSDIP
jgi:hypothetical protein